MLRPRAGGAVGVGRLRGAKITPDRYVRHKVGGHRARDDDTACDRRERLGSRADGRGELRIDALRVVARVDADADRRPVGGQVELQGPVGAVGEQLRRLHRQAGWVVGVGAGDDLQRDLRVANARPFQVIQVGCK